MPSKTNRRWKIMCYWSLTQLPSELYRTMSECLSKLYTSQIWIWVILSQKRVHQVKSEKNLVIIQESLASNPLFIFGWKKISILRWMSCSNNGWNSCIILLFNISDGPDSPDSQNNQNSANTPQTNGHMSNGSDRESSHNHSSGKILKSSSSKSKKGKNSKRNRYVSIF